MILKWGISKTRTLQEESILGLHNGCYTNHDGFINWNYNGFSRGFPMCIFRFRSRLITDKILKVSVMDIKNQTLSVVIDKVMYQS